MSAKVDLSVLAVRRNAPAWPPPGRRRHLLTRYLLPAGLLAGFAALVAYALRETLSPPRPVTVVPVLTSRSEGRTATDEPLFQAAGWVEPRPGPTLVPALTEGTIEELLVVEGQEVQASQPVARLVAADAELALSAVEADEQLRDAELAAAHAAQIAARERAERPVHLQAELAEAEVALARAETERGNQPSQRRAAEARSQQAQQALDLMRQHSGTVSASALAQADAEAKIAAAAVEEVKAKAERLPVEIAALARKRDALRERLERRTDERRQAAESEAAVKAAEARRRQAQAAVAMARLRVERTTVRAPTAGRVLMIAARPGTHVGGGHDSGTVALLYDPRSIQARVDVRLDDVARVQPGMRVRIESAALSGRSLGGEVLLVTSQADMAKNTLPVKVALPDPPSALRPDMLLRVTFLAPPRPAPAAGDESGPQRLLIPRQLVESGDGTSRVWVADRAAGRAVLRTIKLGAVDGELVEVASGLDPTDKLIAGGREGLRDGQRVVVTGEDEALGIPARSGR